MKIILTGGGESEFFESIDEKFIELISHNPKLLYIPTAGEDYEEGLDRIRSVFSTIDFKSINMCKDISELNWDYVSTFGAIYIDGGNTFKLMSEIRNSHFYELINKFINSGGVVNGDSAGAIILGSHLQTAHMGETPDENSSNLVSYQGLNLLGNIAIHCHYEDQDNGEIIEFSKEYGFPILCLYEESSIYIHDYIAYVASKKAVKIFYDNTQKVFISGQSINLRQFI